jgi:hypothetical protein
MHGTVHPLDEELDGHVNCKCVPIPLGRNWSALAEENPDLERYADLPDTRPEIVPGAERFAALPDAEKARILGPTRFEAYKAGSFKLEDLVTTTTSSTYGDSVAVANLDRARRNAANRRRREQRRRSRA